jgi:diguanylate cyclase (GGDEF)-like protein/PAS domain S-box-containing protein
MSTSDPAPRDRSPLDPPPRAWAHASREWELRVRDAGRLAALANTALVDSPAEEDFDRLTQLLARLLGVPMALITLVDDRKQFFKSTHGVGEPLRTERQTPLSHSFCKYVVASGSPLVISDARDDEVLRDNGAVTELDVVAYAGVPICADGEQIGALCVVDNAPRTWTVQDVSILQDLARAVEAQIALRLANKALAEHERLLEGVLDMMPAGVVVRDLEGQVLHSNAAAGRILGRSQEELARVPMYEINHPDDLVPDQRTREDLLTGQEAISVRTKRYRHKDGRWIWARRSASALLDGSGRPRGTIAVLEDVTVEHEAREALARQEGIYRAIVQNIPRSAVLMFDHQLRYIAADGPELLATVGFDTHELQGKTLFEVSSPENVAAVEALYRRALAGESGRFEVESKGRTFFAHIAPVFDTQKKVIAGISLVQDVTEERRQSAELRRTRNQFEATLANISDGVALLDYNRTILLANRAYADLFGLELSRLPGMFRADFLQHVASLVEDPENFLKGVERGFANPSDRVALEFTLVRPRKRVVSRQMNPITLPDGVGYLVIWRDVTADRELMAERERLVYNDALTGIGNRRAAEQALVKELARAERQGTKLSLAVFDIDHFKRINDGQGHATGDEVLRIVANVLQRQARVTDFVARWGGEEFLAVLPVDRSGARVFAERVREAVCAERYPDSVHVTISAGVAEFGTKETQQSAFERADEHLYEAKRGGRNRVHG